MGKLLKLIGVLVIAFIILSLIPSSIEWAENFIDRNSHKSWSGSAYYLLGDHSYRVLRFHKALEIYLKALSKFPNHPSAPGARFRLARCYEKTKDYRRAIEAYRYFLRKYPEHYLAPRAENSLKKLEGLQK